MMMSEPSYHLPPRRSGTAWFGLTGPQVALIGAGTATVVVGISTAGSPVGILVSVVVAGVCLLAAVVPVAGQPLYQLAPTVLAYQLGRLLGRGRWNQPLPRSTATGAAPPPARGRRSLARAGGQVAGMPPVLAGLEIVAVERPGWAADRRGLAPCGLVVDRRAGTTTVVLDVRSRAFTLLGSAGQHRQLAGWAKVLAQFGRETPVARLGWTLRTVPATLTDDDGGWPPAGGEITLGAGHELRLWLTIDARRLRRGRISPTDAALAAAVALTDRCRAAGFAVTGPLSPAELAAAVRRHADPAGLPPVAAGGRGLADRAGLAGVHPALAAPLTIRARWDAVQIDGAWHRTFWVAGWPVLALRPGWLDPLLSDVGATRTLTVLMEPLSAQSSRRRINTEAVSVDTQIQLRDRHAFRVPGHLGEAHEGIDRREAELHAGFGEYAYLGLLDLAAPDLDTLDDATAALVDHAARTGITDLRPLHGRHDVAWAATLPLGRAPARGLVGAG
jgi:hypothetical protein